MKKFISIILAVAFITALVGCATSTTQSSNITPTPTSAQTQTEITPKPTVETQIETKQPTESLDRITESQAVKAALAHANLSESDITHLITEFDIDDGVETFEVDFHYGQYEYDYEINAITGEVISFDKDIED